MNNETVTETIFQGYNGNIAYLGHEVYSKLTDEMVKYILYMLHLHTIKVDKMTNSESELDSRDQKKWKEECLKRIECIEKYMSILQEEFPRVKLEGFVLEYNHIHYFVDHAYYYGKFILNKNIIEIYLLVNNTDIVKAIDIFYNKSVKSFCEGFPTYNHNIIKFKNPDIGPIRQSEIRELIYRILNLSIM